jgi:hypothetical protein
MLGFAVRDSGALETTPLSLTVSSCASGALLVAPSRRHLIALTTGGSGQITYTYDIDPETFELVESLETQPMQTSGEPDINWATGAVFSGPAGKDYDLLFAANTASSGSEGVYLFAIDRVQNPGRIHELDRYQAREPWAPAVHPSGRFVYALVPFGDINVNIVTLALDAAAETLTNTSMVVELEAYSSPRHLAVDAAGEFLYVLDQSKITSFILPQDGPLVRHLSSPSLTNVYLNRFTIHPGGRFLYAVARTTLRAYESDDGTLSELDLDGDPMNGVGNALALTDGEDVVMDATGRSLYVVTRQSVRSFAIGSDGSLGELLPATDRGGHRLAVLHAWRPRR